MKYYHIIILYFAIVSCNTQQKIKTAYKEIDKTFESLETYGFSGGVMIEKNGVIEYCKGFSSADVENDIKNTTDTHFDLGSVTKHITAVGILKLEQEGELTLSEPISKFFNLHDSIKSKITIQQLLNHTSGLEKDPKYQSDNNFSLKKDIPILLNQVELKSLPGEKFRYSNLGYCVLAYIIEKVSQDSYQNFVKEILFTPLGMQETSFYHPDSTKNIALGYERTDFELMRVNPYAYSEIPLWLGGASGVVSSFKDMNIWLNALFGGKVLDNNQLEKFLTPFGVASEEKSPYANGIRVLENNGNRLVFHDGDTNGHEIKMMYFPDSGYRFLFYVNNRDRWRAVLQKMINHFVSNKEIPLLPNALNTTDTSTLSSKKNENYKILIKSGAPYIVALSQKGLFELTDLEISMEEANELNKQSELLANSIIKNDTSVFKKFIDTKKHKVEERLKKIHASLSDFKYNTFEVMGTAVWKPGINQTFIKFMSDDHEMVLRFVWHPKKTEFLFFGSGKSYLAVRKLIYSDSSTFFTYSPKDKFYRKVIINENIEVIKDTIQAMR